MSVQILAKLKQLSVQAGEADQSRCSSGGISELTPDIVSHKAPLNSIWSIVSDCKIYPSFTGCHSQPANISLSDVTSPRSELRPVMAHMGCSGSGDVMS